MAYVPVSRSILACLALHDKLSTDMLLCVAGVSFSLSLSTLFYYGGGFAAPLFGMLFCVGFVGGGVFGRLYMDESVLDIWREDADFIWCSASVSLAGWHCFCSLGSMVASQSCYISRMSGCSC